MIIGELKELDAKYEQYLQNTISNDDIKNATINNILMTFSTNGIMILFNSDFARELNRLILTKLTVDLLKNFLKPKDVLDVDVEINPPVKRGRKSASYKERNIGYSF
jgi:hypothetical protein